MLLLLHRNTGSSDLQSFSSEVRHYYFTTCADVSCAYAVSVSPVTDASYQFGERQRQANVVSRRWAPTSDIDSVSLAESLSDSDVDELRLVILLLGVSICLQNLDMLF